MATKPRTRKDMIAYLAEHFRYNTMNSWNRATSYAVRIKVRDLDLSRENQNAVYEMLDVEDSFRESGFNHALHEFDRRYSHSYQIGQNGRSGGYLVLYQGGTKPSEHKSQCRACGQRNFTVADPEPGQCGRCGVAMRYNREFPPEVFSYPGKSLDMGEDFAEWDTYAIRQRVDLVWDFDKACAWAVKAYVQYARENKSVEEVIHVPKTIHVAVPR